MLKYFYNLNKAVNPFLFLMLFSLVVYSAPVSAYFDKADNKLEDSTIVEKYGQLRVEGNKIVDKNGNPAVLHGMSFFWSQWIGKYYNYNCVKWLRDDWKCTVVRAAMAVEEGGYLTNPTAEFNRVKAVVDAAIELGIYVIVDWHDHNAHNHRAQSIAFFRQLAELYGDTPNIIYEIYNEPTTVSWANDVKPYADSVASNIRSIDPDNLIIVGSPTWSQDVDIAAANPLTFNNIAYSLHFYAATHKQSLRNKAITAMNRGAALFVTEWGTCESSGTGKLDSAEVRLWWKFMEDNDISWCNWSVADKVETAAVLKPGASSTGSWTMSNLTTSGIFVRNKLIEYFERATDVIETGALPKSFNLLQNYPNPFNPETTIKYNIASLGNNLGYSNVTLKVYDILGNEIKTLVNSEKSPGEYEVNFDGSNLTSGVYYYKLTAGDFSETKKLMLLK